MAAGGELSLEELLAALGDTHAAPGQGWDPEAWDWDGLLFQAQPSGDPKACQATEKGLAGDKNPPFPVLPVLAAPLDSAAKASGDVWTAGSGLPDLRLRGDQQETAEGSTRTQTGAANAAGAPLQPAQAVSHQPANTAAGVATSTPSHIVLAPFLRLPEAPAGSRPGESAAMPAPEVAAEAGKRKEQPAARPAARCPNYMTGRVPCECTQADASLPVKRPKLMSHSFEVSGGEGEGERPSQQQQEQKLHAEAMAVPAKGVHPSLGIIGIAQCNLARTVVPGQVLPEVGPLASPQGALLQALGGPGGGGVALKGADSSMGFHAGMAVTSSAGASNKAAGRRGGAKVACQVDGCSVGSQSGDGLKGYYKRHKVCATHAKASTVVHQGCQQRYCQQCGRFHPAEDFDGERRSCRMKLQRHNALRKGKLGKGTVLGAEGSPFPVPVEDVPGAGEATGPSLAGRKQKLEAKEEECGGAEEEARCWQEAGEGVAGENGREGLELAPMHGGEEPGLALDEQGRRPLPSLPAGRVPVVESEASASAHQRLTGHGQASAIPSGCVSQCSSGSPMPSDSSAEPELAEGIQSWSSPGDPGEEAPIPEPCCGNSSEPSSPGLRPAAVPLCPVPALATAAPPTPATPSHPAGAPLGQSSSSAHGVPTASAPGTPLARSLCGPILARPLAGTSASRPLAGTSASPGHTRTAPRRLVLPSLIMGSVCHTPLGGAPAQSGVGRDTVQQQVVHDSPFFDNLTAPATGLLQQQAAGNTSAHQPTTVGLAFAQQEMGPSSARECFQPGAALVHQSPFCAAPLVDPCPQGYLEAVMAEASPEPPEGQGRPEGAAGACCGTPVGGQGGGEGTSVLHMDWQGQGQGQGHGHAQGGGQEGSGQRSSEGSLEMEGAAQGISCLPGDPQSALCTGRMSFKLYQWSPGDFPRDLRCKIMAWLSQMPSELEGYIRPGCTYLTMRLQMPSAAWGELAANPERAVSTLLRQNEGCPFWTQGHFTAQLPGARLVVVGHGRVLGSLPATSQSLLPAPLHRRPLGLRLVHPMVCLDASAPVSTVRLALPVASAKARLLCSFGGKYILDADISPEALAALPLAAPGASTYDANCVTSGAQRDRDMGTVPLPAQCSCGCPPGCACACCSRSSAQKQAACPALTKALLTREGPGGHGLGERHVVAVHIPPLERWGTLSFEVATPSGLTNALSLLVASSSVCSLLRATQNGNVGGSHALGASELGLRPDIDNWDQLPRLSPSPPPPLGMTGAMPFLNSNASGAASEADGRSSCEDSESSHAPDTGAFSRESSPDSCAFPHRGDRDSRPESSEGEASGAPSLRQGTEEGSGGAWGTEFGTALDQSLLTLGWLLSRCRRGEAPVGPRAQAQGATAASERETRSQAAFDLLWDSAGLEAACRQSPSAGAYLGRRLHGLRRALFAEWARAAHPHGTGTEGGVHQGSPAPTGCCSVGRSGLAGTQSVAALLAAAQASPATASPASCCCDSRNGNTRRQKARQVPASEGLSPAATGRKLWGPSGCCKAPGKKTTAVPIASLGGSNGAICAQVKGLKQSMCLISSCRETRSGDALTPGLALARVRKHLGVPSLVPLV